MTQVPLSPVFVPSGLAHAFTQHLGQLDSQQCFKLTKSRQKFKVRNYYREIILVFVGGGYAHMHTCKHKQIAKPLKNMQKQKDLHCCSLLLLKIFFSEVGSLTEARA